MQAIENKGFIFASGRNPVILTGASFGTHLASEKPANFIELAPLQQPLQLG